jgi:hypothetical protein
MPWVIAKRVRGIPGGRRHGRSIDPATMAGVMGPSVRDAARKDDGDDDSITAVVVRFAMDTA